MKRRLLKVISNNLALFVTLFGWGMSSRHAAAQTTITYTDLRAGGYIRSVSDVNQVGDIHLGGGSFHAALWSGTASSFVDLNPAGATFSRGEGVSGSQQVGYVTLVGGSGPYNAALWTGSAASFVNLNPSGSTISRAFGTDGTYQVGNAYLGGVTHAALWAGTSNSFIDLHPVGAASSTAHGVSGSLQVGEATIGGVTRAALWSGSAGSFVELAPSGATFSRAYSINGVQQVGTVTFAGSTSHAVLWSGSADSYVDLHPAGAFQSQAFATSGNFQVGNVVIGARHAALWSGTSSSFVDLHAFLSPSYSTSEAHSIWSDGNVTYIGGFAYSVPDRTDHAILWTFVVPEPEPIALMFMGLLLYFAKRHRFLRINPLRADTVGVP